MASGEKQSCANLQDYEKHSSAQHLLALEGHVLQPAYPVSASALYCCDGNMGTSLLETEQVFKCVKVQSWQFR